jgi:hypothetical protein
MSRKTQSPETSVDEAVQAIDLGSLDLNFMMTLSYIAMKMGANHLVLRASPIVQEIALKVCGDSQVVGPLFMRI